MLGHLSKSTSTSFETNLASRGLAINTMEFVFGDGWEEQCPCRHCERGWLNLGWICSIHYNPRWYLQILDERFAAAGYSRNQLRDWDWDVLVEQLHDELFADGVA